MSKEPKHHYLPRFYLEQWTDDRKRLIEYSRQGPGNFVKTRPTSPRGTGYVRGLNTIPGAPPEIAEFVEKEFMQLVDDWAARGLVALLDANKEPSLKERVGWARFLYSLILRTPEHIERIRAKSSEFNVTSPPQALLPKLINSTFAITHLNAMAWHVADFSDSSARLLTSDRPITMTNGLLNHDSHLALPISPTRLFLAVQRHKTFESFKSLDLVQISNTKVCEQAIRYIYGKDETKLYFVALHLGKMERATPLDPEQPRQAARPGA